jgi:hypothetical protein
LDDPDVALKWAFWRVLAPPAKFYRAFMQLGYEIAKVLPQ